MVKVFITGGTGFIGIPLVNALLNEDNVDDMTILVRDQEKAKSVLSIPINKAIFLGKKISLIKGDITKKNIGLNENELKSLQGIEEVFCLATNVSLSNNKKDKQIIFKTNVEGTKHLLDIFKNSSNIKNIYYFSSAYACGKTSEVIKEDWLDKPMEFRNYYEESKWLSENIIRNYKDKYNLSIIVFRPSIIGASYRSQFLKARKQTIYLYGYILKKTLESLNNEESIRIVGKNSFFNMIPTKDLINLILKIRSLKEKKIIYNLTNPVNFSAECFIKGFQDILKLNCILVEKIDFNNISKTEKLFYDYIKPFLEYIKDSEIIWDTKNTENLRDELSIETKNNDWFSEHIKTYFNTIKNEN